MPTYGYRCKQHGPFEAECLIKDYRNFHACPQCSQDAPRDPQDYSSVSLGGLTDTAYNRGYCNGNQFADDQETGDFMRRRAEKAGVSTTGKVYRHALAEYPGDPQAWTSGLDDARALCRRKGWKHEVKDGVLACQKDLNLPREITDSSS